MGCVCTWNQRQKVLTNGTDRNDVAREWVSSRRILWAIRARAYIGEISRALGVRRNVRRRRGCMRVLFAAPFFGEEEEGFLFVGIVVIRNVDRSTDGIAEVVFLIRRLMSRGVGAFFPGFRVEEIVAQVFEGAAVERSRAGFGFDFHRARTVAAVLRAIV